MERLTKQEIIDLVEEIEACNGKVKHINQCLKKLENGVTDPNISDYIFWSDMTAEEIAEKVLSYQPICL